MKLYKLTDENNKTQNNTTWGPNVFNELSGEGKELCTTDVIHAYKHPLLASFFKPIHCPEYTKLWEAEGDVVVDDGAKVGVKKLTTLKEIELPEITIEQRVKIAILCVKKVYKDEKWNNWADKWLSGEDCSTDSAYAAAVATRAVRAGYAAAYAADGFAAYHAAAAAASHTNAVDASSALAAVRAVAHAHINIMSIIEKVISETV